ncbi:hypothetical protein F4560_002115 [Saccharothrix ecbatanensis]|uniref:Uncharacterized protein n=1 Tax=Saccharothrix ecbatanensis TaxID=1105145 RepID=A0A7W9M042_9PSEU|nr:hypothetical protein [Saccharothrix ecbatanensis]MBB5802347.1 hypothetical protein [Saccharothrix ecbatanensis]
MKVTRVAYSADLNAGKLKQLAEQARRLGVIRSMVWREHGSINGAGIRDRVIRDRWIDTWTPTGTLRLILRNNRVEVHYTIDAATVTSSKRPRGNREVGVDKGYSEVLTDRTATATTPGWANCRPANRTTGRGRTRGERSSVASRRKPPNAATTRNAGPCGTPTTPLRSTSWLEPPTPTSACTPPHTRVKQIIQERDRRRSRLPDQDSNTAGHCRCGERNIRNRSTLIKELEAGT